MVCISIYEPSRGKTNNVVSEQVRRKLICAFVFTYADCWFSHEPAHIIYIVIAQILQLHIHYVPLFCPPLDVPSGLAELSFNDAGTLQCCFMLLFEPVYEKTNNLGFQRGPTQTRLYCHRRWLEAGNFGFRK